MRRNSKSEFLKHIGVVFGLAVTVMMLAQTTLFAQSTGTVTGTVYDQSGAVVPKAHAECGVGPCSAQTLGKRALTHDRRAAA